MSAKIWLSSPHLGCEEMKYIQEAFAQNWVAPLGANVDGFEQDLENYLSENRKVAVVNTGTAGIHLALRMLGVSKNDEVLCQSLTFCASANPIVYQGATPILVDSEPKTWNICPNILEEAIKDRLKKGKKPKAMIIVHIYGMPAKVKEILEVSKKYEIPIIEDTAEALGSQYQGRKCGTFGDFSVLSFNGNKIITTSGGGALVCKTSEEKKQAIFLSTQARDEASHYQHSEIGYNYRMSNICAGIGRGQMEVLEDRIVARRRNHRFYQELFKPIDGIEVFSEPDDDFFSNHWLSVVQLDKKKLGFDREDLRQKFLEENIETRPVWKPLHLQPVFADVAYYGGNVAENLFKNGLCLPSGSNLTKEDLDRIKTLVYSIL
ncbi:MAG: aminotransferase class I/II-fold pyridoxal phosphate-dependent enzyme [Flavobacteriaceae bacterium]|nr:aminotransferase class I/II-fold pyridoxal phosphate-dependent enzyme [Flavobacteriaceae bacterium]